LKKGLRASSTFQFSIFNFQFSKALIYFDNNSTTRAADEVVEAMRPYYTEYYGNPHAAHQMGRRASDAIEIARAQVAQSIGAKAQEIFFTSCGTESNALVLRGIKLIAQRHHITTTAVEHPSVLKLLEAMEAEGRLELEVVDVTDDGAIDFEEIEASVGKRTALVSIMLAQNETGVIHDVRRVADLAHERGTLVHVDAVQAVGKIPVDVSALGADFLSLAGHKFHAPKGIGALYVREGLHLDPLWEGGGHESGLRSGTQPVPLIVGLGTASALATQRLAEQGRVRERRDRFEAAVAEAAGEIMVNGRGEPRLPNTSSIGFRGLLSGDLIAAFDAEGLCSAPGAACNSGKIEASGVLTAMSVPPEYALGTVRFSLSRYSSDEEVDQAVAIVAKSVRMLHGTSKG